MYAHTYSCLEILIPSYLFLLYFIYMFSLCFNLVYVSLSLCFSILFYLFDVY